MGNKLEGVFPLKGVIQNYAWGGTSFLSDLFKIQNADNKPMAEYWIGVHPRGVSEVKKGSSSLKLNEICELSFLLKILDVNQMLSIQSHPNKAQAEVGFEKEDQAGIAIDAKHRIFKDDNHKPELMVALSDFWLLHGFQKEEKIKDTFSSIPEFHVLESEMAQGIKEFYTYLLKLESGVVEKILAPLKTRLASEEPTDKNNPDYWANLAFKDYGFDKGIFSIYLFNLVYLKVGESIYQEAGIPHAYLEGQNIEIMANSDNVFRAGLTPKHIDTEVLLAHLDFTPVDPIIIKAKYESDQELLYKSPAKEFELRVINLEQQDYELTTAFDECFIVMSGDVTVVSNDKIQHFGLGASIYSTKGQTMIFKSESDAMIVRATCPH